jgi:transcriptional regulator with XRE-family HTH domain
MQVTDEITWHMRSLGVSRAELATRMGVSAGRVSQVLSGGENITLRTLVTLAAALDARFEMQLHSDGGAHPAHGQHLPAVSSASPPAGTAFEIARIRAPGIGFRPNL